MKKLVLVRHGEYGRDDHLNRRGFEQISALCEKLKEHVNGKSVLLLTSIAHRARESAGILSYYFDVELEEYDVLWSESGHRENFPLALELVNNRKEDADVVVLVTHYEYVERFPGYFSEKELGVSLRSRLIEKGQAWVIDCEEKSLIHLC